MHTLRAAGELLANAQSIETLAPIAAAIGCTGAPCPLDADARSVLGLDGSVDAAYVASGVGALRALMICASGTVPLRDVLPRIAARLSSRAPHVLWMVIATQPATRDIAIVAWTDDRRPPRIAALVANRARLVDSDAETLRALSAAGRDRDLLTHARWVEILGREALTVRFYRALERALTDLSESSADGSRAARDEMALLNSSRLLFLSFLEAKGWLDGNPAFIAHHFDDCMTRGGRFHHRVLRPLFFGTLNTPVRRRAAAAAALGRIPFLNGGLFARTPIERRHREVVFSDEAYGRLIATVFGQYRFTAREETASWSEAAVDPEMLGRAFESLMVSAERRRTGAFYTPVSLVARVADAGLQAAVSERVVQTMLNPSPQPSVVDASRRELEHFSVLDPACGSGAFLVHVLERVAGMFVQLGDRREPSVIRRDVLTRSIYGVDVNPTAVWLCELRLWLSVVIDSPQRDPAAVLPLPNLDRNIRVGDSLSGRAFGGDDVGARGGAAVRRLRQRYANASGSRKESLGRQLDRAERERALRSIDGDLASIGQRRHDLLAAQRGRDLFGDRYRPSLEERAAAALLRRRAASLRAVRGRIVAGGALPFSFSVHFADVAARGGFGLVVGNPPWVRLHAIPVELRAQFRREFDVARTASWEPGAAPAGAGRGFAAQVDMAALFVERSIRLLAPRAALALLLPVKLWHSLAGGGVRRLLDDETDVRRIEDFSEAPAAFDAAVYPSLLVAQRRPGQRSADILPPHVEVAIHHRGQATLGWHLAPTELPFDGSRGAPWILLPRDARRAFDLMRDAGLPLAQSPLGRAHLGVKCGCNDAFVVGLIDANDQLAEVRTRTGKRITVERSLLRPLIRGEHLKRWQTPPSGEYIIWTHDALDAPLAELPPRAARWFARWRRDLVARTDARHRARWWSLFRTESARFDRPRVVWGDVGREPRACVLPAGDRTVALNSCYVARCRDEIDARAFAALLNGPLARAWLNAIAEPARGGYRRYLGWTLGLLPIPTDWDRAREPLASLGDRGYAGDAPSEGALFDASLAAYSLRREGVAPLVVWSGE